MNYFKKTLGLLLVPTICLTLSNIKANDYISNKHNSNVALQNIDAVGMPKYSYIKYNVAVQYKWDVGFNGDTLYMGNYAYIGDVHSTTHSEIKWSRAVGNRNCDALAYMAKSYNYSTKSFSDMYNLEHTVDDGTVRYGEDCNCSPIAFYDSTFLSGSIPTSFDQDNFIWKHNHSNKDNIEATIQYNDVITNMKVAIPFWGTNKTIATLDGVTFELRTGPNKCSIRTTSANISVKDIRFGFGCSNKDGLYYI